MPLEDSHLLRVQFDVPMHIVSDYLHLSCLNITLCFSRQGIPAFRWGHQPTACQHLSHHGGRKLLYLFYLDSTSMHMSPSSSVSVPASSLVSPQPFALISPQCPAVIRSRSPPSFP